MRKRGNRDPIRRVISPVLFLLKNETTVCREKVFPEYGHEVTGE
jgi:hypothetical protein